MRFIGHLDIMRYFQKAMQPCQYWHCLFRRILTAPDHVLCGTFRRRHHQWRRISGYRSKIYEIHARIHRCIECGYGWWYRNYAICCPAAGWKKSNDGSGSGSYIVYFKNEIDFTQEELEEKIRIYYEERSNIEETKQTKKSERVIEPQAADLCVPSICGKRTWLAGIFLQLSAGSTDNIKPELVLQDFYQYFGKKYHPFNMQIHRVETYEHTENGLRPLYQAGDVIEA